MTDGLNLIPRHRKELEALLREHVPDAEVWAYGSRVNGRSHDGSDLDLALRGPGLEPLGHEYVDLLEALEQSNIPILVQAHDWARLPESFHREIEQDYVVVQKQSSGWQSMPFSEAVIVNPPVQLQRGTEYPFVDMAAVNPGIRWAYAESQRKHSGGGSRFQDGDTLMARITPCLENGKIARYRALAEMAVAHGSTEFIVIRGCPGVTDNEFAYYLTQSPAVRDYSVSQMTGTSGRQRVPNAALDHIEVALPPLTEQRRIAHILGTLDDKIELNRRMNETLEAMARAIFQDWFVDFGPVRAKLEGREPYLPPELWALFPDRLVQSELGEIPEGWEVKALGEVIELAYGKALKAGDRKGGDIPVYGSNGQVGWHDEKLSDGPGIVVGRKGNPGIVTWAHSDFFPIDTAFYGIAKIPDMSLHFLFYALVDQDLPSVSADSAVPGLNRNLAYMNSQLVPDDTVVEAFGEQASELFRRRHHLETESRSLAAQRDALLPRLVSGELRV